jgi:hypothetical protein
VPHAGKWETPTRKPLIFSRIGREQRWCGGSDANNRKASLYENSYGKIRMGSSRKNGRLGDPVLPSLSTCVVLCSKCYRGTGQRPDNRHRRPQRSRRDGEVRGLQRKNSKGVVLFAVSAGAKDAAKRVPTLVSRTSRTISVNACVYEFSY